MAPSRMWKRGILLSAVGALAQSQETQHPIVTVDSKGAVETITPTVVNGVPTPSIVVPAAPTVQPDGSGVFLVCDDERMSKEWPPFCDPPADSGFEMDTTYFITWNPNHFENDDLTAVIQGSYDVSRGKVLNPAASRNFTAKDPFAISKGFYQWHVDPEVLPNNERYVQLYLAYVNERGTIGNPDPGPLVRVFGDDSKRSSPYAVWPPILMTVGILLILAGIGWGVWVWGKHKQIPWILNIPKMFKRDKSGGGGSGGYGVRKSRVQRAGTAIRMESNLGARDVKDPAEVTSDTTGGRNVFREELRRQEQEGRSV